MKTLLYSIKGEAPRLTVEIWEPATPKGDRILPFIFKVRSVVETYGDAIATVRTHEITNNATASLETSEVQNLCQAS